MICLHDFHTLVHTDEFVEDLLTGRIDYRNPRNTHPARCIDHLAIEGDNLESRIMAWAYWAAVRECVSSVQVFWTRLIEDMWTGLTPLFICGARATSVHASFLACVRL